LLDSARHDKYSVRVAVISAGEHSTHHAETDARVDPCVRVCAIDALVYIL
jgi:hypothetical protein